MVGTSERKPAADKTTVLRTRVFCQLSLKTCIYCVLPLCGIAFAWLASVSRSEALCCYLESKGCVVSSVRPNWAMRLPTGGPCTYEVGTFNSTTCYVLEPSSRGLFDYVTAVSFGHLPRKNEMHAVSQLSRCKSLSLTNIEFYGTSPIDTFRCEDIERIVLENCVVSDASFFSGDRFPRLQKIVCKNSSISRDVVQKIESDSSGVAIDYVK